MKLLKLNSLFTLYVNFVFLCRKNRHSGRYNPGKRKSKQIKMCSSVAAKLWFLTDRRIREDYPQKEILRALKAKCCEEELDFRAVVMDEVVLTIEQGNLGKSILSNLRFLS